MKQLLACLTFVLCLGTAHAAPSCPPGTEAPLSEVAEPLKPGAWVRADAFDTFGQPENPLGTFHPAFKDQLTVARQALEIRGFIEPGGRAAVVLLKPAQDGFCVLNAWMSPSTERFSRFVLVSMWRAKDSQRAMLLVEATGDRAEAAGEPVVSRSVVLGTTGKRVWKAFEASESGLAFDPQAATLALLGAGEPLFLDASGQFRARPAPKDGSSPLCPKTANGPLTDGTAASTDADSGLSRDKWIPSDAASQLYQPWNTDELSRVAFRKLLTVKGRTVEAVGLKGNDAVVVFLAPAPKGFCVLNFRYWSWGGNGVELRPSWWQAKDRKLAVLLLDVTSNYHHGADEDDPRSEEAHLALATNGTLVRAASAAEESLARPSRKSP